MSFTARNVSRMKIEERTFRVNLSLLSILPSQRHKVKKDAKRKECRVFERKKNQNCCVIFQIKTFINASSSSKNMKCRIFLSKYKTINEVNYKRFSNDSALLVLRWTGLNDGHMKLVVTFLRIQRWTTYKHVKDKSKKCLSVGNSGILGCVLAPAYVESWNVY